MAERLSEATSITGKTVPHSPTIEATSALPNAFPIAKLTFAAHCRVQISLQRNRLSGDGVLPGGWFRE